MSSPFDEAKYKRLLEGLEISIISLSEVIKASYSQRIDSYFFQKEFLNDFQGAKFKYLSEICTIKSGTTPPDRDNSLKKGIILLKTDNIRNGVLCFTSTDDFSYINEEINHRMSATKLRHGDILINIVGATTEVIGRCSLLSSDRKSTRLNSSHRH